MSESGDKQMESVLVAIEAADYASGLGWLVVGDQVLLAINPDDSSEVWTFYHEDVVWRRKGEPDRKSLRSLNENTPFSRMEGYRKYLDDCDYYSGEVEDAGQVRERFRALLRDAEAMQDEILRIRDRAELFSKYDKDRLHRTALSGFLGIISGIDELGRRLSEIR